MKQMQPIALFLLSAAALAYEIILSRLFSVAQFYHFAFVVISIAMLGFSAGGTFLVIFPGLSRRDLRRTVEALSLASGLAYTAAWLLTIWLPFDSFRIAWDVRQAGILLLHEFALALPFFFTAAALNLLLAADPAFAGRVYSWNLFGSAAGCGLALAAPALINGEGVVALCSALSFLAAGLFGRGQEPLSPRRLSVFFLLIFFIIDLSARATGRPGLLPLAPELSPYKGLSYALQHPGARLVSSRWNAFSRVDVVRSAGIRSLPGLSYRYLAPLPAQDGAFVDGNDMSSILLSGEDPAFLTYLPQAAAFTLRPGAHALVLEPRGGLDILVAAGNSATHVTSIESNPLLISTASKLYSAPNVDTVIATDRSYLRQTREHFDVILISLTSGYHPVRSGAYSLAEDYRYTVEALQDALDCLSPGGLLTFTRWYQSPPAEPLRAFALAVTALERNGAVPSESLAAFRGYNTFTVILKNGAFSPNEIARLDEFTRSRAFDVVYAPGVHVTTLGRFNLLQGEESDIDYAALFEPARRSEFYASFPYDISPPEDDRPFFGHFFRLRQVGQVVAEFGKTWQPFGGAGYLVILALLILALVLSAGLVLLPAAAVRRRSAAPLPPGALVYFILIGLAYLLVEVPLIQRFILYLGQPAYAMSAVLFSLLLFSGLGSRWGGRISLPLALAALAAALAILPALLQPVFHLTLGYSLAVRLLVSALLLALPGYLMGAAFPGGIRTWLAQSSMPGMIAIAWAANGAASVIASILSALVSLSLGFHWVLAAGAISYAVAAFTAWRWAPRLIARPRP